MLAWVYLLVGVFFDAFLAFFWTFAGKFMFDFSVVVGAERRVRGFLWHFRVAPDVFVCLDVSKTNKL
jgi:hypothetical protein